MKLNIFLISSLVGVLWMMIRQTQAIPIEIVYTGDSCDCPRKLNYMVNVPPPPKPKEYKPCEYGYKLDVPIPAKAKVTYSFDFTVQEPVKPPPTEEEKWHLYAKVDRITAHKKDCLALSKPPSACGCHHCATNYNRYVSSETNAIQKFKHPNSISKIETTKLLAIFLEPLEEKQNIITKSRNKRDISRIFLRGSKNNKIKRKERLVKQYRKSLQSRSESPNIFTKTSLPAAKAVTPLNRRPFENFKNLFVAPRFRNKRDIKGEYDLIEKEREQLDLTLPEIIQYMPETLNPNFKRGQCKFSQCKFNGELQEPQQPNLAMESSLNVTNDNIKETLENIEDKSNVSTGGESENEISSTLKKRNVADYGYGLNLHSYNPHLNIPIPTPGYSFEPYVPTNYEYARPRPFSIKGLDIAPQQFLSAPHLEIAPPPSLPSLPPPPPTHYHAPIVGAIYNPYHDHHATNAELDRIIADIVNRHPDFIEASTHPGGALVDATRDQVYQTKSLLKNLWDGHWKKFFNVEPLDNTYSFMPYYQATAPDPTFVPRPY